jgi:hypothetical protein
VLFVLLCLGCSRYETPSLPELDRESISPEEILRRQEELKRLVEKAHADE